MNQDVRFCLNSLSKIGNRHSSGYFPILYNDFVGGHIQYECPGAEWTSNGRYCYFFQRNALDFDDAEAACNTVRQIILIDFYLKLPIDTLSWSKCILLLKVVLKLNSYYLGYTHPFLGHQTGLPNVISSCLPVLLTLELPGLHLKLSWQRARLVYFWVSSKGCGIDSQQNQSIISFLCTCWMPERSSSLAAK